MTNEFMIYIIMGTRPEIIKFSPLIDEFNKQKIQFKVIFTGQHYEYELSEGFFNELKLKDPDFQLGVGSGTQGEQTAKIIKQAEKILVENKPSLVLVQGDTNSALAGALSTVKLHIPIGHIEAGLRSYDFRMAEEHNRRLIDHMSSYLFTPTEHTKEILINENVWGQIYKTGNTVIDACIKHSKIAEKKSTILEKINFADFLLFTTHRSENVDDFNNLNNIITAILDINYPTIFPVHPRTLKQLKKFKLYGDLETNPNVQLLSPISYFDTLKVMKACDFIITDSGGIQEEATAPPIRKFTFVIRKTTDRPESCEEGFAELVGTKKSNIIEKVTQFIKNPKKIPVKSPYGDGTASSNIISILKKNIHV